MNRQSVNKSLETHWDNDCVTFYSQDKHISKQKRGKSISKVVEMIENQSKIDVKCTYNISLSPSCSCPVKKV